MKVYDLRPINQTWKNNFGYVFEWYSLNCAFEKQVRLERETMNQVRVVSPGRRGENVNTLMRKNARLRFGLI
jgi:hypothetical protein